MQMQGSLLLSTLQNGQLSLLKVQQQLSSGDRLNMASDDPAAAVSIAALKRQINTNKGYAANLDFAAGMLSQADAALGGLSDLINEAQGIANSQAGLTSADERAAQAEVINSLLTQALSLGNQRYQGQSIFGGQNGIQDAFASVGGGYKYQGTSLPQTVLSPTGSAVEFSVSGNTAFGAVSSQVVGYRNLGPALTSATRLADLHGAQLAGVHTGPINLTVGATTTSLDLSAASTAGDVVSMINAALLTAGSDAAVSLSGTSLVVSGDSTLSIAFGDAANGTTAADLGLPTATIASGSTVTGAGVGPILTNMTPLAALNGTSGISPAGIVISNGANSATVSLSGLTTVEDFLNAVNGSGTNVHAEINADGTGINLFNPLSGNALRIGENGGTTADDLGIRSLNASTNLADLNNSTGVTPIAGTLAGVKGQINVTRTDGTQFAVQVDGVKTPSQLIAAINAAGGPAVTAALNSTGNGITLTDTTGGPGNLAVAVGTGFASNGSDIGILRTGSGGTLTGTDITLSTDDFRITRRDGSSFTVSLGGSPAPATIQDVLDLINNADGNSVAGTKVTASLNTTGNGISLADASSGGGALTVTAVNGSQAAGQLGIEKTAPGATPGVIAGDDNNPLQPRGVFSSLTLLRDALLSNDSRGIAQAAALLQQDSQRAIKARGVVGAREKDIAARREDVTGQQTQLKQALSLLADTDFTEAATRFQQIQTAYQASLQVASTTQNLSLMDFLK
jgi:flagellar hook-associated protein 3 FlgL